MLKKILSIGWVVFFSQLATAGAGQDPAVAELNGTPLLASKALAKIEKQLTELAEGQYRLKESTLTDYLKDQVVREEARKQNTSKESLLEKESGTEYLKPITDHEINAFLKEKGLSLSDKRIKKEDIKTFLKERKKFAAQAQFVDKLFSKAKVKLLLEKPPAFPLLGTYAEPLTIGQDPVVAELNGKPVKASEAFADYKQHFFEVEDSFFSQKKKAIIEYANDQIRTLNGELVHKISEQYFSEMRKKYGENFYNEVSDKDVTDFLASKGLSLADKRVQKTDVIEHLKIQREKTGQEAIESKLREAAKFKLLIVDPQTTRPKG